MPVATDRAPVPCILVADDQEECADNLARLLQLLGYRAVVTYDGEAAVAAAREHRPAAAILDLHMPVMGGLAACTRIRQLPGGKFVTMIALTGSTRAADREAAELAGFDQFLVKPLMVAALLRLLPPLPEDDSDS